MTTHALLLGRTPFDDAAVRAALTVPDVEVSTGTSLSNVESTFANGPVDVVIMGAGLSLQDRLDIIDHVFRVSDSTTVHMKDRASGQPGMMPFVNAVLRGLTTDRPA